MDAAVANNQRVGLDCYRHNHVSVCTYVCMHTETHTHTDMDTDTHTHTQYQIIM